MEVRNFQKFLNTVEWKNQMKNKQNFILPRKP